MKRLNPSPEPTSAAPSPFRVCGELAVLQLCRGSLPGGCGSAPRWAGTEVEGRRKYDTLLG